MDEKYDESSYELEEDEEEYDEGMEGRLDEIEKNMENMRSNIKEDKQMLGHNAFSRELGPPEPFTEDRIVSSDEVEKMVIDETKSEDNSLDKELQGEKIDSLDEEIEYEKIGPDGEFKQITEEQFKEGLAEDSFIEGSIEGIKLDRDVAEGIENYDQPGLVQKWEEMYHSEKEEVLSQEALDQLQQSMDAMEGLESVIEVETVGDPISVGSADDLGSELGSELDTESSSELDSEQDEDSDLDMDMGTDFGSNI